MKSAIISLVLAVVNSFVFNSLLTEPAHATQAVAPVNPLADSQENEKDPATAELISNVKTIKGGEPFWIALKISLQPGWHVYWRNPGDSGLATQIDWSLPEGFTATPIQWLPPQRFEMEKVVTFGYANEAYHLVQITPPQDLPSEPVILKAKASWLACKDSCTPGMADLDLNLPVSSDKSELNEHKDLFEELIDEFPTPYSTHGSYKIEDNYMHVSLPKGLGMQDDFVSLSIIPYDKELIKYATTPWVKKSDHLLLNLDKDVLNKSTGNFKAIVQIKDLRAEKIVNTEVEFDYKEERLMDLIFPEQYNIFIILLFAFLGGLILNAMPCVFPILSLKAMSIVREAQYQRRHIRLNGLYYTLGVVLSFFAMAVLLLLIREGGQNVGWGFQMQNPYFIYLMIGVFYFMGLSLSGEIHLPMIFGNTQIGDPYSKEGRYSNFWIGMLAVLVATPCTGPFMGVAMWYAFTQDAATVLLVFLALGLGFAFPFILISCYTPILKIFPKPGRWMETIKEFMAFPMYLSVAWLLWVLVQQTGDRGLFAALMSIILMRFSIWFGKRYPFTNPFLKYTIFAISLLIIFYPITYIEKRSSVSQVQTQNFSQKGLAELRNQKKPVFLYATAAWCITCKVNELALTSQATEDLLNQKDVILMVADWTNENPEITDFLAEYGRNGVPLYVYYPPDEKPVVLPQILTESIIRETIMGKSKKK